jgi:hypothetical protein
MGKLILLVYSLVFAGPVALGASVQADLLASHAAVRPGDVFRIGLQLHITESEGILVLPQENLRVVNTVRWKITGTPAASRITWAPASPWAEQRLGYEGVVMLEGKVRMTPNLPASVVIQGRAGEQTFETSVAVGPQKRPINTAIFTSWDERVPLDANAPEMPSAVLVKTNGVEYRVRIPEAQRRVRILVGVPLPAASSGGAAVPIEINLPINCEWVGTPEVTGIWYLREIQPEPERQQQVVKAR